MNDTPLTDFDLFIGAPLSPHVPDDNLLADFRGMAEDAAPEREMRVRREASVSDAIYALQ